MMDLVYVAGTLVFFAVRLVCAGDGKASVIMNALIGLLVLALIAYLFISVLRPELF